MPKSDNWGLREKADRIREFIFRKQRLRRAYRETFLGADGKPHAAGRIVLAHLARISRAHGTIAVIGQNGQVDPHASFLAEGQRVLFTTITMHLNLDDSDLYQYEREERAIKSPE
jgi:hypothetical protein